MSSLLLLKQFPKVDDISTDDLIEKIRLTLGGKKGKVPCLLIVLDEVQQYIGESLERSKAVQDLQEQCCARLGANVLFVATGQNALSATPLLIRLQGRFPVTIELQDTDVEQVTRELVLKKKPSAEEPLKSLLEAHSGEIERHLASSKIAPGARDRGIVVRDYPLLPVRRRFWERVLRAVDKTGTGAQLRTQLWIVYDAVEKTADLPLGNVVDAAFIFDHIQSRVLQSGVLLQEISETIAKQVHEEDGLLRFRLCALIFLIGQLPHRRAQRRGHPGHARGARRPAGHRPEPEQRRAAEEDRRAARTAGRRRVGHAGRERVPHADPRGERVEPGVPGGADEAGERRRRSSPANDPNCSRPHATRLSRNGSWSTARARSPASSTYTSERNRPRTAGRTCPSGFVTAGRLKRRPSWAKSGRPATPPPSFTATFPARAPRT